MSGREMGNDVGKGGRRVMIWVRDSEKKHGWLVSKATRDGGDECLHWMLCSRETCGISNTHRQERNCMGGW